MMYVPELVSPQNTADVPDADPHTSSIVSVLRASSPAASSRGSGLPAIGRSSVLTHDRSEIAPRGAPRVASTANAPGATSASEATGSEKPRLFPGWVIAVKCKISVLRKRNRVCRSQTAHPAISGDDREWRACTEDVTEPAPPHSVGHGTESADLLHGWSNVTRLGRHEIHPPTPVSATAPRERSRGHRDTIDYNYHCKVM